MSILRKALKTVFPLLLLKRLFLIYNSYKIKSIDRIFFKENFIPKEDFADNQVKNPFLELGIQASSFNNEIQAKFSIWNDPKWIQDQYLLFYRKPGFLEPRVGWALSLSKELIYPSLGFSSAPHVHKPDFIETYFKKKVTVLQRVISLRDTGEENYFHFFNDVLSKLFYLRDHGIVLNEYKIVVSERLYKKSYFQFFLKSGFLYDLRWHVQGDEWIKFDEAIFCKPYTHTKKYFDQALVLTHASMEETSRDRRIFVTRSINSLRFVENFRDIEPILSKFKFEIIDTVDLTMEDQISLFAGCRYLVAIHGAGITNIIFRNGKPLSLLEIFQPNPYAPFHYIMLSKLFNYKYDAMLGQKGKLAGSGGFVINPADLESKILAMVGD